MVLRLEFDQVKEENNRLIFLTDDQEQMDEGAEIIPTGQMLADSDNLSFIYVIDTGEESVYVSLPKSVWSFLKKALDEQLDVEAQMNDCFVELKDLHDELAYLIDNIEDNPNYGDDMIEQVELHFLQPHQ
jgi:hypothetical protein